MRSFARVAKGGLIAAVVESWVPSDAHSYGILLEDDIEVSPFFYLYAKHPLLSTAAHGTTPSRPPRPMMTWQVRQATAAEICVC